MIALDANTTLRSFLDGRYDVVALISGLATLAAATDVQVFKYADGKVQPIASADLVHSFISSFPSLKIGALVVEPTSSGLQLWTADGSKAALHAKINGASLVYTGSGATPVSSTWIHEMTVRGSLVVLDGGALLDGKSVNSISAQSATAENLTASSVSVETLIALGSVTCSSLTVARCKRMSATVTSAPNVLPGIAEEYNKTLYFNQSSLALRACDEISLTDSACKISYPAIAGGKVSFSCSIPFKQKGGDIVFLTVGTVASVSLTSKAQQFDAPTVMKDLLLWPSWRLRTDHYSGSSYATAWAAAVPSEYQWPAPVITVRNDTDSQIADLAHAWQFGRESKKSTLGVMTVLHRISLPPHAAVEFLFSYDAEANAAFMFPMRILNG